MIDLVVNLKNKKYSELAKVISSRTTHSMLKSLRKGRPSATDLRRANSMLGQVKPSADTAREISSTEHQFTLVNQRGLRITFVCKKEGDKFMIVSLKTQSSRNRRR